MPALPSNTYRTAHGFQFRMVVPESLRAVIGKREIKQSLGKDYRTAVSEARLLAVQVDRQFAESREQLAGQRSHEEAIEAYLARPADRRLKAITTVTPDLVTGLKSLWLSGLDADLAWRRDGLDDDDFDDLQANISETQQAIAKALARGKPERFLPVVRQLLVGRGYDLVVTPEAERQLVLDLLPAIQEGYDILAQRQAGRMMVPVPTDEPVLPASWEPAPACPDHGFTWDDLLAHWRKDRIRPPRTDKEAETLVRALRAFLPRATPATVSRAQAANWLRHERETRGNSAKTLEKKGTLVGALFSVAVKDELLEKNPFAGFDYSRFAAKEGIENPDAREPFTEDQLKRIFSSDEGLFSVSKDSGGGGYHARVWIPLVALLSGARLDEIGSLRVVDIVRDPVPHLHIRQGKTQSSVREVPLHPRLIQLGFLKYVEAIESAGHQTLWPHLHSRSTTASDSEVLGRWFNRYLHDKLKLPRTVVFHSFRHTFKDLCRDALIPRDLHHALTGHAKAEDGKKNVGDEYGKGYSIETKLAQIRKIKLGFDLPRPKAL
jgi:integrase